MKFGVEFGVMFGGDDDLFVVYVVSDLYFCEVF